MSYHQDVGQNNNINKPFENGTEKFIFLGNDGNKSIRKIKFMKDLLLFSSESFIFLPSL
jgi:hypothetical protein